MRKILGKNFLITMMVGDLGYPVFCAKSGELSTDIEEIEVTSVNSGRDREYEPGMVSRTLSVSGLTELDNTGGRVSIFYLLQQLSTVQMFRLIFTDTEEEVQVLTFRAFATNLSVNKNSGQLSQSTGSFRISGAMTFSSIIPPPNEAFCDIADPIYMTLGVGATSVTNALLTTTGVEILGVWRSGLSLTITSGTPGSGQFAFDPTTGTISIDPTNPGNDEPIHIIYKISG